MTKARDLANVGSVAAQGLNFRNKIINGDMRIDQRNAGASVTSGFGVDRWPYYGSQPSKGTLQQNAGSVTPPPGFTNYVGFTSTSAYSVISTDFFEFYQGIEGLNIGDLAWGTANAKTVTLSFWVRSSLTGTFGGFLGNHNSSRVYPYTYTISAANTWEYKTVVIAGDTSGTWLTNNQMGIQLAFTLGAGSAYQATGNAWNAGTAFAATGQTSVVGTNGATFYITGVQLEKGTQATPFEHVDFGTSLQRCQRYFTKSHELNTVPADGATSVWMVGATPNSVYSQTVPFHVRMRANPSVTLYNDGNGTNANTWHYYNGSAWQGISGGTPTTTQSGFRVGGGTGTFGHAYLIAGGWKADAEL